MDINFSVEPSDYVIHPLTMVITLAAYFGSAYHFGLAAKLGSMGTHFYTSLQGGGIGKGAVNPFAGAHWSSWGISLVVLLKLLGPGVNQVADFVSLPGNPKIGLTFLDPIGSALAKFYFLNPQGKVFETGSSSDELWNKIILEGNTDVSEKQDLLKDVFGGKKLLETVVEEKDSMKSLKDHVEANVPSQKIKLSGLTQDALDPSKNQFGGSIYSDFFTSWFCKIAGKDLGTSLWSYSCPSIFPSEFTAIEIESKAPVPTEALLKKIVSDSKKSSDKKDEPISTMSLVFVVVALMAVTIFGTAFIHWMDPAEVVQANPEAIKASK